MWTKTVEIKGPYDFTRALDRLSLDPLHAVDMDRQAVKVPVTTARGERTVAVVASTGSGTVESPGFTVAGGGDPLLVMERVREIFGWDVDLMNIHEHFQSTDLRSLFNNHYGTPLILDFDPFGSLVKCIIHQQLNLAFAYTLTERFVKAFGTCIDGAWFYPTPEKTAGLTVAELRELQFSGRKAEYVIGIAEKAASGELDFERLKTMPDAEVEKELIQVRGVGPWTVQNFLMFALRRTNLFPFADIGLQNALKKHYQLERKPSIPEMEQLIKPWEPYLTYASLYLWRSIE